VAALAVVFSGVVAGLPAQAVGRPENGRIAFGRFDPDLNGFSLWAANPDGTQQRRLTQVSGLFSDWSPDGTRIAFDFFDDVGNENIATIDPEGGHPHQLTFGAGIHEVPRWSPDGRWITFDASPLLPDDPEFSTAIWVMRSDGTQARRITFGGFDVEPVFSPDGSRIAFARLVGSSPQGDLAAIYVVNTDGTGLHQVVAPRPGLEHPDWAPQSAGGWLTFNIGPEAPDAPGSGSIMVVHPNGSGLHVLRAPTRGFKFYKPIWSPDGHKLLSGCSRAPGTSHLCVMNAHGSNLTTIISDEADHVNFPAWGSHPIVR
jgi:TolB protein